MSAKGKAFETEEGRGQIRAWTIALKEKVLAMFKTLCIEMISIYLLLLKFPCFSIHLLKKLLNYITFICT
jgi:hypothetical protein